MGKHPLLTMAILTAAAVGLGGAWSIRCGLFLDDQAHYQQLRQGDWSYRSAVAAARLGIVGDVMDLWSGHEAGLRFYRPVAFWLMRLQYTIVGWHPAGMHVFSLAWHWFAAMLVGLLAWRLLERWTWASVAAVLMALHPGHVLTVYWIACQTELMATAFGLLAMLCYARYAGWWEGRPAVSANRPPQGTNLAAAAWLAAALLWFALALGCREHLVMWPAAIAAGDLVLRSPWRRRFAAYPLLAAVVVAYLLARTEALGGFPLPGRPYLVRPGDEGFLRYIADKFVYYINGLFACVPVVPIGGTDYFAQRPVSLYGTFAGTVAIVALILAGSPHRRSLLFPLAWTSVFFVPLLPVFASSHHLYLPGAGMAVLLAAGLATLTGTTRGPRRTLGRTVTGLQVLLFLYLTITWAWTYQAGTRVEDVVVRDVLQSKHALRDGDHLFFANVPMLAYYAVTAIENETGLRNLRGHVLTFSPWVLQMEKAGTLDRTNDDRTLILTAPPGESYFGGVSGQTLLAAMGLPASFRAGDRIAGSLYDVTILEADGDGVRRLRFDFHRSLASPDYHLFYGSPIRFAYPLY